MRYSMKTEPLHMDSESEWCTSKHYLTFYTFFKNTNTGKININQAMK